MKLVFLAIRQTAKIYATKIICYTDAIIIIRHVLIVTVPWLLVYSLAMNMNLAEVLTQAEELFYKYCRQNITRGFVG